MKVTILHRPNATAGGDWIAANKYSEALKRQGVDVDLRPANDPGDLDCDFAHLWAACSPDWGVRAAFAVKKQNKPLIITPFWWSRAERQAFYGNPGQDLAPGYTEAVAATLQAADVLFTVTMSEAVECWKLAPGKPVHIIPMGIDAPPIRAKAPGDYVLCIGRIEPHKNQAMLARACHELGLPLVLIGSVNEAYVSAWLGTYPVTIIQDADDDTKWQYLAKARIHALPSFFENPGLAHGEALSLGIPAVMGGHGCEPEFYGEGGIYCDPTDIRDIKRAVSHAWDTGHMDFRLPTWDDAARRALSWLEYCLPSP